jgi:hypothetical protein
VGHLKGQLVMSTTKKPEDPKPKTDFDDIKQAFDAELEERAKQTDDKDKRKDILSALRNK